MEAVGTQVKLPFSKAFEIAVQGIRIRFGRSLVTVSGVVLGMAFLMSNITGQLIKKAVAGENETRQTANLMLTLVSSEIGVLEGKVLAVAVYGRLSAAETLLISRIAAQRPAELRGTGTALPGVTAAPAARLSEGAGILLVLGDQRQVPAALSDLAAGMRQKVIIDSLNERIYKGQSDPAVRRELFFGAQLVQYKAKLQKEAVQARIRTIWIVIISLLVTVIGVSNALLMSVTERFREIGTMKCLGALSSFIRMLFLVESSLIGLAGSVIGVLLGALLSLAAYGFTYGFGAILGTVEYGLLALAGIASISVGTLLAVVAALYPANFASRMVPASALRSTV